MEIKGEVKEIIYQNEINSYTVATFEMQDAELIIVGYLPFINVGDTLHLTGKMVTHQDYGEQFKVDTFEKLMPESLGALERYLANGTIKGVGPATAKKIVDTFKEETISVLKFEPEKLTCIKGIHHEKAIQIAESFVENWELWQIVGFLEKFGIGVQNAKNVYKTLGSHAVEEIQNNPYVLVDVANHVDFKKIDQMAMELGLPYNFEKRIKSGIKHAILCATVNGHCCVLKENLITYCVDLLKVSEEEIEENLIEMKVKNQIVEEVRIDSNAGEATWIYLTPFYQAEENIATRLSILSKANNMKYIEHMDKELKNIEKESDIDLSEKQREVIQCMNEHNVCIITGGPGTGKTTIIKTIMELYKRHGKKPVLCAPTGRAAKRMTETTGEEAKTLHRLLEIGKIEEEGKIASVDFEVAPLDADVVIVDEMSMVDLFLMNYLVKALYQGTKLVLVGDVDQLPSVGPGSILKDLIASKQIPTIVLDKIFRQAAKSKIILNAHRVNEGENFLSKEDMKEQELKEDFFFIKEANIDRMLGQVISLCQGRLKNYGDYDFFKNIQVITPTKKGLLGTRELNKQLQQALNPENDALLEKKIGDTTFREQDRIMQIKNNYDLFWERKNPTYETGSGVFNGELGTILKIDEEDKMVMVQFDDEKVAWYPFQDLDQIEHAYSITIHKAQGSEFDVVIMVIPQSSPMLLTRNLLYTGMTRAKQLLIVIGNSSTIDFMIKNTDTKKRNTGLTYKLENMIF